MVDLSLKEKLFELLKRELVPALGCTEPSAIAYATALLTKTLKGIPSNIDIQCSSFVVKNVHSVSVPNGDGLKGIEAAAVLGAVGGIPEKKLEVLNDITADHIKLAKILLSENICSCSLADTEEELYIKVEGIRGIHKASIVISGHHTDVKTITLDGCILHNSSASMDEKTYANVLDNITLEDIYDVITNSDLSCLYSVLDNQVKCNQRIAYAGLEGSYGVLEGKFIRDTCNPEDIFARCRALASAGSDARMNGCAIPVVINSGSGNQGMTVSLPVAEFADSITCSFENKMRALALANYTSLLQKNRIGNLSAFCGAVCAAAGAAAGICFLEGGTLKEISDTVSYTLGTIGGMVCDGAKSSCASKINAALEVAFHGMKRAMAGFPGFKSGDGIIGGNIDKTINRIGIMGRSGMIETNKEILAIMLDDKG